MFSRTINPEENAVAQGQFVKYTLHADAERPEPAEQFLARDPDKLAACHETLLARKRWVQYLDACSLKGGLAKIVVGGTETPIHVAGVERSMNVVTECFVLVSGAGLRYHVTPETVIYVANAHAR